MSKTRDLNILKSFYSLSLFFVLFIFQVNQIHAQEPAKGYQPRACGFDMDRDGIFGEPEDCRVCNATLNSSNIITGGTQDPDNDGVNEDMIYIDCSSGVDQVSCGTPGNPPCKSISYAWSTRADGPSDGAEDILCFRSICKEQNLSPKQNFGGVTGANSTYSVNATGSEAQNWLFSKNPAMLVGWDADADGCYAPYDDGVSNTAQCGNTADVAILEPTRACENSINQECGNVSVQNFPLNATVDPDPENVLCTTEGAPSGQKKCIICTSDNPDACIKNRASSRHRYYQRKNERTFLIEDQLKHLEFAHFTARDYGRYNLTDNSGFFDIKGSSPTTEYINLHDILLPDHNRDSNFTSATSTINSFDWLAKYIRFENIKATNNGYWFVRGGRDVGSPEYGPFRWQNVTVTFDACKPKPTSMCDENINSFPNANGLCSSGPVCTSEGNCEPSHTESCTTRGETAWKLWGHYTGIEILDSIIDTGFSQYANLVVDEHPRGIDVAQCTQNWTIRHNDIIDFPRSIEITPESTGFCDAERLSNGSIKLNAQGNPSNLYARPVTNISIDKNTIYGDSNLGVTDMAIYVKPGGVELPNQVVGNVSITNNVISSKYGREQCIAVEVGHGYTGNFPAHPIQPVPGSITIANNSCYGNFTQGGALLFGAINGVNQSTMQQHFVIKNNIIAGMSGTVPNITTTYAPSDFSIDYNAYDPDGKFRWNSTVASANVTLADWKTAGGVSKDMHGKQCIPTFLSTDGTLTNGDPFIARGNVRLSPVDICAKDSGVDLASLVSKDIAFDNRPDHLLWDIGADEVAPTPLNNPPLRFIGAPTGILANGTSQTTLSLKTDQNATCSYSTSANIEYGNSGRKLFSTTGNTTHTTLVQNLTNGTTNTYYIRCKNQNNIVNSDDYIIQFQVAGLTTELVGHWKLDENTGCSTHDSANNHNGNLVPTCSSNAPTWTSGKLNKALHFDGNDDGVSIPNDQSLNMNGSFTLSAWIYPENFGNGNYGRIASKQKYTGGFGTGYSFYVGDSPTTSPAAIKTLCANINITSLGCGSNNSITLNTWQHVLMTFDGSSKKVSFFVNGSSKGEFTALDLPGTNNVPFMIGIREDMTRAFKGNIDDVRLYKRVLSQNEIVELSSLPDAPAQLSNGAPTGNLSTSTTTATLSLNTNTSATCKYSLSPNVAYSSMSLGFSTTGNTLHTKALSGLENNKLHRYYVRCQTQNGVVNEQDYKIEFYKGFYPSSLSPLFFVEPRQGIARVSGNDMSNVGNYCDTNVFSEGCIRSWQDQSSFHRTFGQDDLEKPGFISNCINGFPCAQGGLQSLSSNWHQNLSFEIENEDTYTLSSAFSIIHLAHPVSQSQEYYYYGSPLSGLRHNVDNSLSFHFNTTTLLLTAPNAVSNNIWHLIEVYRDTAGRLTIFVDGVNKTLGNPQSNQSIAPNNILSQSKGTLPMEGRFASQIVYGNNLSELERTNVRAYMKAVYGISIANNGSDNTARFFISDPITGSKVALMNKLGEIISTSNAFLVGNGGNIAVSDIDQDSAYEIVIGKMSGGNEIVENELNGRRIRYFPSSVTSTGINVALCDFDGDGNQDHIVTGKRNNGNHVMVYDFNGLLTNVFYAFSIGSGVNVACGNVDGDAREEIIVGKEQGGNEIVAYTQNGNRIYTVKAFEQGEGSHLVTQDIDQDGKSEIIVGKAYGGSEVVILNSNGTKRSWFTTFGDIAGIYPAIGDMDEDGTLEILVGKKSGGNEIRVFNLAGVLLNSISGIPGAQGTFIAFPK